MRKRQFREKFAENAERKRLLGRLLDENRLAHRDFALVLGGVTVVLFAFGLLRLSRAEVLPAAVDFAATALFGAAYLLQRRGRREAAFVLSLLFGGFAVQTYLLSFIVIGSTTGVVEPQLVMVSVANILLVAYMTNNVRVLTAVSVYAVAVNLANVARHFIQPGAADLLYLGGTVVFLILGLLIGYALFRLKRGLVATRDEAQKANEAKSMFLSNMSHEIRTPMNGIDGLLRELEKGETDPERRHYLSLARTASKSLRSIIDDILELSKLDSGTYSFREVDFPPRKALEEVLEVLSVKASEKGLELTSTVSDAVPEVVHGDPDRLKQVLFNLVGNAIKYTETGSITIRGWVGQRREDSILLVFEVADTGVGMTEEEQELIFQPFSQLDSSYAKKYKGTGLGLAISKRLSESMGGGIWCESEKEVGSTFSFTAWLQKADPAETSTETTGSGPQARALSILVAEDDRINQVVIRKNLERAGHFVKIVGDGKELLEVLPAVKPDVVLMDVQMPGMDGVEATRHIRSEMPEEVREVPVIALTAYVSPEDRARFLEAGMDAHTQKPLDLEHLYETMNEILREKTWRGILTHEAKIDITNDK